MTLITTRRTGYVLLLYSLLALSDCNAQVRCAHVDANDVVHVLVRKSGKSDKIKQYFFTTTGIHETSKFTYIPNSNSNLFPLKWTVSPKQYTLLSNELFPSRFGPSVFHKFKIERQDSLVVRDQRISLIDSLTKVHGDRSIAIAALGLPQAVNKKNMMFIPFQRSYKKYNSFPNERNVKSWAYDFKYGGSTMDSIVVVFRVQESLQKWILSGRTPSIGRLDFEVYPKMEEQEVMQASNVVDSMFFEGDIYFHRWKGVDIILNLSSGYLYDVSNNIEMVGRVQVPKKSAIFLLSDSKRNILWVNHPIKWVSGGIEYNIAHCQIDSEVVPIMDFFTKERN